jgi:peptidoglycan/LPS O-acetylase OafA/YrhL
VQVGRAADRSPKLFENLNQRTIPCLGAFRGIAALCVLAFHTVDYRFPGPGAVAAFFLLSGFLITWLLLKEKERYGHISIKRFWFRRSLRIFPAFYTFWIVQMIVYGAPLGAALASFFYVFNYWALTTHPPAISGPFGHTWSLAVEEQFYLLWPLVLARVRKPEKLVPLFIGAALAIQAIRVVLTPVLGYPYTYAAFEMRCDALMMGCATAIYLNAGGQVPEWLLKPGVAIVALCAIFLVGLDTDSLRASAQYGSAVVAWASLPLMLQAVAIRPRWLDNAFMQFLGLISYSVYLYYHVVIQSVETLGLRLRYGVPLEIVATILVATASYLLIERPALRLKDRLADSVLGARLAATRT